MCSYPGLIVLALQNPGGLNKVRIRKGLSLRPKISVGKLQIIHGKPTASEISVKQDCLSVERRPSRCVYLIRSCDLDPMTLTLNLDLDILKTIILIVMMIMM